MPPANPGADATATAIAQKLFNNLDMQMKAREISELLNGFRQLVLDFVAHTDMSQTRFGYEAAGQVDFVRLVKAGRDFRMSTVLKVLAFIADQDARKSAETKDGAK